MRSASPAREHSESWALQLIDGRVDRLTLRVTAGGAKTRSVRCQSPVTGRQERVTLGPYPGVALCSLRGNGETWSEPGTHRDPPK